MPACDAAGVLGVVADLAQGGPRRRRLVELPRHQRDRGVQPHHPADCLLGIGLGVVGQALQEHVGARPGGLLRRFRRHGQGHRVAAFAPHYQRRDQDRARAQRAQRGGEQGARPRLPVDGHQLAAAGQAADLEVGTQRLVIGRGRAIGLDVQGDGLAQHHLVPVQPGTRLFRVDGSGEGERQQQRHPGEDPQGGLHRSVLPSAVQAAPFVFDPELLA